MNITGVLKRFSNSTTSLFAWAFNIAFAKYGTTINITIFCFSYFFYSNLIEEYKVTFGSDINLFYWVQIESWEFYS